MIIVPILAATAVGGLLINFLYAVLVVACVGGLVWAINTYIHPIPPPVLAIVAIVLVILVVLWLLGEAPTPFVK